MPESTFVRGDLPAEWEEVICRFESAWRGADRPDPERFLPTVQRGRTRLLFELVHVDLDSRLRRGEETLKTVDGAISRLCCFVERCCRVPGATDKAPKAPTSASEAPPAPTA